MREKAAEEGNSEADASKKNLYERTISLIAISAGLSLVIVGCAKSGPPATLRSWKGFSDESVRRSKSDAANAGATQGQGDQIQQTVGRAVVRLEDKRLSGSVCRAKIVQAAPNLTLDNIPP